VVTCKARLRLRRQVAWAIPNLGIDHQELVKRRHRASYTAGQGWKRFPDGPPSVLVPSRDALDGEVTLNNMGRQLALDRGRGKPVGSSCFATNIRSQVCS
jgi:hypothetical protein